MRSKLIIAGLFLIGIIIEMRAVFQIISQPGLYQLGENITYSPAGPNDVIFQITASNVEFDLGDRFITQSAANTQTGLIAIQIASGLSNVVIKSSTNGSIQNIRGTGIQVLSNCSRILLDNITTFSCDDRGIDFVGSLGNEITDSKIQNCNVIGCCRVSTASSAILLSSCNRLQIDNVNVNANGLVSSSFIGISFDTCLECNARAVLIQDNTALDNLSGLSLVLTCSCAFTDCLVENNATTVNASTCDAYLISNASNNNIFKNCIAISTAATGGQASGFQIAASTNAVFDRCLVEASTGSFTFGFFDNGGSVTTCLNCIARNNIATTTAGGFFSSLASNNSFVNCIAVDQTATAGIAIGFDIANSTNSLMQECLAARNNGTPAAGNSFGVRSVGNTNPVFVQNVASRNGTVVADQFSGVAAGAVNNALTTGVNSTTLGPWTNLGLT